MTRAPRPAKRPDYAVIASAFILDILIYLAVAWVIWGSAY